MSESLRRSSLRKSSIGIDSISKSISSLSQGLISLGKQTSELLKETRKSNLLKSNLIRQDAEFFRKRRENVLRKQREDELEATNITGVTKRQGNIITNSTRGFLGRMLDFLGTLIVGWALLNLPKIIKTFQKLFGFITRVVGVFTEFISGMRNFFESIGSGIDNFLGMFKRFDFREDDKNIKDTFEKTEQNLVKINQDFSEAVNSFATDKDILSAEKVAKDLGISGEVEEVRENIKSDELKKLSDINYTGENAGEEIGGEEIEGQSNNTEIESTDEIERRNLGGPVEAGQPVIVGDAAGIDSRSAELFVPDVDGRVVSNNELEDVVAGDEGTNEIDNLLSGLEDSTGTQSSSSPPPSSSGGGVTLEEEKKINNIKPVRSSNVDIAITPVSREIKNLKRPKKPKTIMIVNNQNNTQSQSISGTTKTGKSIIVSGNKSSAQTVLELQSTLLSMG